MTDRSTRHPQDQNGAKAEETSLPLIAGTDGLRPALPEPAQFRMVLISFLAAETMDPEVPTLADETKVEEIADRIARRDPAMMRHQGFVIVDKDGKLAGILTRGDVLRALDADPAGRMSVLEAGTRPVIVAYADEVLHDASAKMLRHNIGCLPVVDRKAPDRVIGYLGRPGILSARLRRLEDEHVREPGWMQRFRRAPIEK